MLSSMSWSLAGRHPPDLMTFCSTANSFRFWLVLLIR